MRFTSHYWTPKNRARGAVTAALVAALTLGVTACSPELNTSAGDSAAQETAQEATQEKDQGASTEASPAETAATITVAADDETSSTVNGIDDKLCSWTMGGTDASTTEGNDYAFTPVVYVADGAYAADKSIAGETETVQDDKLFDTSIVIDKEAVNGVMVKDSTYALDDVSIEVNAPDADGSTTCDFSGLGAALAAYGDSDVTVSNSRLTTSGVANLAVFCDNGAKVLLDNVELSSAGGTLYEDYVNSPSQPTMVAPPWILGIMGNARGTNLMGTNSTFSVVDSSAAASNWAVLSTDAGSNMYLNVVNSTMDLTGSDAPFQAGDVFNVENPYTTRTGYGTYAIGDAVETFLGTRMNVGTYATIFTGGTGYYGNLEKGKTYELLAADGSTHSTYTATEDAKTQIESDTFGFMAHKGTNKVEIDGASVHSAYTGFLIKSGNDTDVTVKGGAELTADNGILVQLMDNDDSTTAYDNEADAFAEVHEENAGFPTEAVSAAGSSESGDGQASEEQSETIGTTEGQDGDAAQATTDESAQEQGPGDGGTPPELPSGEAPDGAQDGGTPPEMPSGEAPQGDGAGGPGGSGEQGGAPSGGPGGSDASGGSNHSSYAIEDTALEGSIYNGIGWNANELSSSNVSAMTLDVSLSGTASLKGAIASTSCIHASYDGQQYLKEQGITAFDDATEAAEFAEKYQLTSFTKAEYFNIGQVANLVSSNGLNDINVSLSGSSVWTVTDTSLVASLTVADDAQVVVEKGVTLTVGDQTYEAGTYTATDFAK